MTLIDKETIRAEIERRIETYNRSIDKYFGKKKSVQAERDSWKWAECKSILAFLDTLPEQPVEYPTSTEMIAEWENNELPMLREKDFRGDAERMAYNAFMDGFAKGLGYRK